MLAGTAMAYGFSTVTTILVSALPAGRRPDPQFRLLGSLGGVTWAGAAAVVALGVAYLPFSAPRLNTLALGDAATTTLGIDPPRFRRELFLVCAADTGVLVAVSGAVGFVGLTRRGDHTDCAICAGTIEQVEATRLAAAWCDRIHVLDGAAWSAAALRRTCSRPSWSPPDGQRHRRHGRVGRPGAHHRCGARGELRPGVGQMEPLLPRLHRRHPGRTRRAPHRPRCDLRGAGRAAALIGRIPADGGTDAPFTSKRYAGPQENITRAGGDNVVADLNDTWTTVSREPPVAADPNVIVVNDHGTPAAARRIEFLETFPPLAEVTVVLEERVLRPAVRRARDGPRNPQAIVDPAAYLNGLPLL